MKGSAMRCSMNFGDKQNSNVTLRHLCIESKENVMRMSMLAVAVGLIGFAAPAPAQTIIDVENPKPAPAPEPRASQPAGEIPNASPDNAPAISPSRFTLTPVDNGFLRLDSESGQVAFCSTQGGSWTCQTASEKKPALDNQIAGLQDEVAALKKMKTDISALQDGLASVKSLQSEIIRLRDDVAALKKEIVALQEPPPPRPPADLTPPGDKGGDVTIKLPTREEMARASALIQETINETWRRFVDMINSVQKDMMRKG
jgi:hypothetical protein